MAHTSSNDVPSLSHTSNVSLVSCRDQPTIIFFTNTTPISLPQNRSTAVTAAYGASMPEVACQAQDANIRAFSMIGFSIDTGIGSPGPLYRTMFLGVASTLGPHFISRMSNI